MKKYFHRELFVLLGLVVLVTVVRVPSLEEPLDNDSASIAYHAHLILQGEPLYGTHHPGHHLPGPYYTYAIAYLLFGESGWAVKFMLIPWILVISYLIYRFGARLRGLSTGILAAVFFTLVISQVALKGTTGEPELFANLPRFAAVWLCVECISRAARNWTFALVGGLSALALLFKAIYISPALVAIMLLAIVAWREGYWGDFLRRLSWMAIGFGCVIIPVIVFFTYLGLLNRLLLVFSFGMGYISDPDVVTSIIALIIAPIIVFGANNLPLLCVGIASFFALTKKVFTGGWNFPRFRQHIKTLPDRKIDFHDYAGMALILWFVLSIIEAGIGHPGFPHYNLLLVPHFSLLAAWGLVELCERKPRMRHRTAWLAVALTLSIVSASILANRRLYYHFYRFKRGMETYESFLQSTANGRFFLQAKRLADYVGPRTSSRDYVYFWSDNMIFFNLVHRQAPIENLWPYYAHLYGSYKRIFVPRTKYIILGESFLTKRPQWLYDELAKGYRLETVIDGQEIYRRRE